MILTPNTKVSMSKIRKVIARASVEERVILKAREIVGQVDGRDPLAVLRALSSWVAANVGYTRERRELFQDPLTTIRVRTGDCDDHTILVVSLAQALKVPAVSVLVASPGKGPHHIVPGLLSDSSTYVFDTTEVEGGIGVAGAVNSGDLLLHPF